MFRDCKPLATGIDKQLITMYREIARNALAIRISALQYLKKMEK
jgi:hypothetical protein